MFDLGESVLGASGEGTVLAARAITTDTTSPLDTAAERFFREHAA